MTLSSSYERSAMAVIARLVALALAFAAIGFAVHAIAPAVALAEDCEDCKPDDPGGGGSPGPGPSASSPRITITGTFEYADFDPAGSGAPLRRLVGTRVTVVGPTESQDVVTRADGTISVSLPFVAGGEYEAILWAENRAAVVPPTGSGLLNANPFSLEKSDVATSASSPLDLGISVTNLTSALHYNIAETIRLGRDYADAQRDTTSTDPRDQDVIERVIVRPNSAVVIQTSFYNAPYDAIELQAGDEFEDAVLLHEYGHYLEEKISSLPWNITIHNGCIARDLLGNIVNSSGHAWMEGFANYFAAAVGRSLPQGTLPITGNGDQPGFGSLEPAQLCSRPAEFGGDTVELFVSRLLWDLFDQASDNAATSDDDAVARGGAEIFRIFDRELDMATWIGGPFPTIVDFDDAWRARGLGSIDAILNQNGILPPRAWAPSEEPPPEPDPSMCRNKPWTPGC